MTGIGKENRHNGILFFNKTSEISTEWNRRGLDDLLDADFINGCLKNL